MAPLYLKRASIASGDDRRRLREVRDVVGQMVADIGRRGEDAVRYYARSLESLDGDVVYSERSLDTAGRALPSSLRARIDRLHVQLEALAGRQADLLGSTEAELVPGVASGQRHVPLRVAGVCADGQRYAGLTRALAAVCFAKAVGVGQVTVCARRGDDAGCALAMLYALRRAGADVVMNLGGVPAVASLAFGLFGTRAAEVVVGARGEHANEALLHTLGGGGTPPPGLSEGETVIADALSDPVQVADELARALADTRNARVRLLTDDRSIAEATVRRLHALRRGRHDAQLRRRWHGRGEAVVLDTREAVALAADAFAARRACVLASQPRWWLERLVAVECVQVGRPATGVFGETGEASASGGLAGAIDTSVFDFVRQVRWHGDASRWPGQRLGAVDNVVPLQRSIRRLRRADHALRAAGAHAGDTSLAD